MPTTEPAAYAPPETAKNIDLPPPRATNVRYGVLGLSIAMAILLYLDRFALNAVQPIVMEELGINLTMMGWVTSTFFWAYALAQVPAGWLGDRWGGRNTLALYVAVWSVAFALQALAFNFWILIALRIVQGIAQAGAYAVTASYLKNWIEPGLRGFANSSVSMGGRAGKVLTDIITPRLILLLLPAMVALGYTTGNEPGRWREAFLIYGALGLVWAWVFWRWFRNTPAEHPGVNAAELKIIYQGDEKPLAVSHTPAPPFVKVLANRNLWLLSGIMFFVNVGWIFLATSLATYLNTVFGWSLVKAGSYSALTAIFGMAGCLAGGFTTDWLSSRFGELWGRRLPGVISCGGAAAMYVVALNLQEPEYVVYAFACVYFLSDFLLGALWSTVQDVGRRNAGAMFGFINMSGNLGAAIFPPVIGMLVKSQNWSGVFIASAAAFCVSLTLWFFVDPRVKLPEVAQPATSD